MGLTRQRRYKRRGPNRRTTPSPRWIADGAAWSAADLRRFRKEVLALTQLELATRLGLTQASVSMLESGERRVTAGRRKMIEALVGGGRSAAK